MRLTGLVQLRRLCRRCAFGLAVPFGFWLGAWPSSCAGAFVLPGAAAAAMPPVRFEVGCAIGFGSGAWRVSRVGAYILPGAAAAASPPVRIWVGCAAWVWAGCMAAWMCCGYAGHRRSFSPYKQSPPLRGGCRRQPAGGGVVRAPIPPASLMPGRSGSYVSACAVRHDLRPAALQLFTTAPSVSEYFALYLQYDCTAARQRYAAKTAAAANSGWEVWAWPYLQRGGPVTVCPTE